MSFPRGWDILVVMRAVAQVLLNASAVFITSYILPGVNVDNFVVAIIVAVLLGIVNMFLRPILVVLTIPVTILSLGLFIFVINAVLVLLVGYVVPGFSVDSFWWALLFSLVLSVVVSFLNSLTAQAAK